MEMSYPRKTTEGSPGERSWSEPERQAWEIVIPRDLVQIYTAVLSLSLFDFNVTRPWFFLLGVGKYLT